MEQYIELVGVIELAENITGTLLSHGELAGVVTLPNLTPPVYPVYDGSYNAIPRFEEQYLKTKNKLMNNNVTVEVIPVQEVSNPQGGTTVTIG